MSLFQEDQEWFFVRESAMSPAYQQKKHTFKEVQSRGITFQNCLDITSTPGPVADYTFYIHSQSMTAAVRMLTDEAILATHQLYCRNDPVVTITVRYADDPSPNSSRAPSHQSSLAERRKVSRGKIVPELFLRNPVRHTSGEVDLNTLEAIQDVPDEDKVTIELGNGSFKTYTKEYLLCWITAQVEENKALTDIVVNSFGADGQMRSVTLTNDVWERSLIRGPWHKEFLQIWNDYNQVRGSREATLSALAQEVPGFSQACSNFIHDLRTFSKKSSRERLESTGHEFYLGLPYFNHATRDKILEIPTKKGSVASDLRAMSDKRQGEICAAHDFAPFFQAVLGVNWDKEREKGATFHHQMSGLTLGKGPGLRKKASELFQKLSPKGKENKRGSGSRGGRGGGRGGVST